jgi:scyllo-inositol 2-dehydrogenase (NADP+)
VRYIVVGLGNLGSKRRRVLSDRCVATVDPINAAADYAEASDCPTGDYDAAVLAVPTQAKLALLEYFLGRGKYVLVEKPLLFDSRASADRLDRLARRQGAGWYTSYNHRFEPLVQTMKQRLDAGQLGSFYYGRLFYGNGTVGNVVGTWRDQGLGVLEDLGSHLLDLSRFLLGGAAEAFRPWSLERHEASSSFDHCIIASDNSRLVLEVSFLAWKNTFTIDLFGNRGSMHLSGLPKWGPSSLIARQRVLPSGVPTEEIETLPAGEDLTWERDLEHFEAFSRASQTSVENDLWLSETLQALAGA